MVVKTLTGFKGLAIIAVVLLGFLVIAKWDVQADTSNPYRLIVAQNETQTATNEKNASAPASKEPESKADEKKESTSVKEKPLKDFQPSERIEAEQAVDFPYDI
ncbi:MAG: hypothetical protein PVG96_15600 [Desulfobacterales bacterium]|jgi:hypothetical protein